MRAVWTTPLVAGALLAPSAVSMPASAGVRDATRQVPLRLCCGGLVSVDVEVDRAICVAVDVAGAVGVRLAIGASRCGRPLVPRPPAPPPPTPKPPPGPRQPVPPKPRPPARPAPPRAAAVRRPVVAAPSKPRPTPASSAPSYRERPHRAFGVIPRRKSPLGTVMVLVIMTVVIAAGTGAVFAAIR